MSIRDEFNKSIDDENEEIAARRAKIHKLVIDELPKLSDREMENDAKRLLVNNIPDDLMDEWGPRFLDVQRLDIDKFATGRPPLPDSPYYQGPTAYSNSASGTITSAITSYFIQTGGVPDWAEAPLAAMRKVADTPTRKAAIAVSLERLHPEVANSYRVATRSVELVRADSAVVSVSTAAKDMRGTIDTLWGHLIQNARRKCAPTLSPSQPLNRKTPEHRIAVANCLAVPANRKLLLSALDDLNALHHGPDKLSGLTHAVLAKDVALLLALATAWHIGMENVGRLVET